MFIQAKSQYSRMRLQFHSKLTNYIFNGILKIRKIPRHFAILRKQKFDPSKIRKPDQLSIKARYKPKKTS